MKTIVRMNIDKRNMVFKVVWNCDVFIDQVYGVCIN